MKNLDQRGFSFTELLITVVLIIVAASIAMPYLQGYTVNRKLESATRDIESDFYELKEMAISENNQYTMTFDVTNNNYTLNNQSVSQPFSKVKYPTTSFGKDMVGKDIVFTQNITKPCYNGASSAFIAQPVYFQTRGTLSPTTGTVLLTNSRGSTATITFYITGKTNVCFNFK